MDHLTSGQAQRAIYIDFECLKTRPHPTPKLLGILGDAGTFEQLILDPALAPARVAKKYCRVIDPPVAVADLVERCEREDRLLVGWSFFDRDVAMRANPAVAERVRARYRNAIQAARPWRQWIHPSSKIERDDPHAPRHTLDKYAVLAGYPAARRLANAEPAKWIRRILGQLAAAKGRYRATPSKVIGQWHDLLTYNEHDCRALRHIALRASRELDAWRAYERTKYCFDDGRTTICFRIGSRSGRLEAMLSRRNARRWAFLTAWNPGSVPLTAEENRRRQAQLVQDLRDYEVLPGEGIGDDPSWEPERSLMVLGISRGKAVTLAQKYGQLAIVVGTRQIAPKLVPCAPTPALP